MPATVRQDVDPPVDERTRRELRARLISSYAGRCTAEQVDRAIDDACKRFQAARIQLFVPIFVERAARDALDREKVAGMAGATASSPSPSRP